MDLDEGNPFLGAFEGVGWALNLDFLGPNGTRYARCPSKSIPVRPAPCKQQVH
jgi:hypothetical protein